MALTNTGETMPDDSRSGGGDGGHNQRGGVSSLGHYQVVESLHLVHHEHRSRPQSLQQEEHLMKGAAARAQPKTRRGPRVRVFDYFILTSEKKLRQIKLHGVWQPQSHSVLL